MAIVCYILVNKIEWLSGSSLVFVFPRKHCPSGYKYHCRDRKNALEVIFHNGTVISSISDARSPVSSIFRLVSGLVLPKWRITNCSLCKHCPSDHIAHCRDWKNALEVIFHNGTVISSISGARSPASSIFRLVSDLVLPKWRITNCALCKHCPSDHVAHCRHWKMLWR